VIYGIQVLLIGTGIGLVVFPGGDAGDGVGVAGDGVAVAAASSNLPKDLLYMLNGFQLNSGDVRHSLFVDRDRYWVVTCLANSYLLTPLVFIKSFSFFCSCSFNVTTSSLKRNDHQISCFATAST